VLSSKTISEKRGWRICKKGSEDKADNVRQRLEGVDDNALINGKTQYGKLQRNEHTDDLNTELTVRGLEEYFLLGWKEKRKNIEES
jgi:hypothetical protein